jgi:hypothetical protein
VNSPLCRLALSGSLRAATHDADAASQYFRHGTLSLHAAFNTNTGEVLGKTAERLLRGVCGIPHRHRDQSASWQRNPCDCRQPVGAQEWIGSGISGDASQGSLALHFDLLVVAQPGRTVVRQNLTRRHRARGFHFRVRSEEKAHALHPAVPRVAVYGEVEICRPFSSWQYTIICYRPLVRFVLRRSKNLYRQCCKAVNQRPG